MGKILLGMAAAALWFVLSQAANAERICQEICDNGICISRCVDNPDSKTTDSRALSWTGRGIAGAGVDIDVGR